MSSEEKFCVFEPLPDGRCVCVRGRCGLIMPADKCGKRVHCKGGRPGALALAGNFSKAVGAEAAARLTTVGRATKPRTEEEIAAIQAICRSNVCGLYNAAGDWCEHRDCGCSVKRKPPFKMAKCPMKLWPLEDVQGDTSM